MKNKKIPISCKDIEYDHLVYKFLRTSNENVI